MTALELPAGETATVEPRCRHFGVCGGCQLQHLGQAAQLAGKVHAVQQQLARAGVPVPPIVTHAAEEYGYRNRIRLRVQSGQLGYSQQSSHVFLPVSECPIAMPLLWQAAAAVQQVTTGGMPWPEGSAEMELMTDGDARALQLLLHVDATVGTTDRDAPRRFRALCEALHARLPQLAGAGLLVRGELAVTSRRVQERQRVEVARWGTAHLRYAVNETEYTVSRGAFFQVNRFLTGEMVRLVLGNRTGHKAWDLFAGAGLFSLPLTGRFRQVVAVEVGQPAADDLREALLARGGSHRVVAQPVLPFLSQQRGTAPACIVMDPPRAGLGSVVTAQLKRIGAAEMVYVSCDATTFARDARALVDSCYTLQELHLLDLFPQTRHTETIAVFRRS